MGKEKKGKKEVSSSDEKENVGLIMKIVAFFRNENTRVAVGIVVCFLCLYLLLAFISFFFTGGEDQSFIQNSVSNDSSYIRSQIQNWAGYYGALAADFFINRTCGVSCFAMLFFFVLLGVRLILKNISFSLKKVFFVSSFLMIWSSLFFGFFFRPLYDSSFMFLGGEHGHQIGLWFDARIGWLGTILLLFSTMLLFCIF
ncbi:MAG: DNA translocase FtsK 4TM domain-containing protein, partial [Paludibacteraceae bacterium]|nr:DNA translocase FtsK 4TM domain-containing protein [Paludibacteraceae bacterium]